MNRTAGTDSAPPVPVAGPAVAEADAGELLGIGAAAAQLGVSERALRYYQQLGLLRPACTPGGLRRYSADDIARVTRIRELQDLLGLNLDEIAIVLSREDRMAEIRTGISGNLCRCTGYKNIVAAVRWAAEREATLTSEA